MLTRNNIFLSLDRFYKQYYVSLIGSFLQTIICFSPWIANYAREQYTTKKSNLNSEITRSVKMEFRYDFKFMYKLVARDADLRFYRLVF